MKKFLFWTTVVVGILAAVALLMNRRADREDASWQGDLEGHRGSVTKAVNDAMSGPDATDNAKDSVDAAAERIEDAIDLAGDTASDVTDEAKDVAAKAKRASS